MKIEDKTAEMEEFIRFNFAICSLGAYSGLVLEQKYMGTRKYRQHY
jgi:hypothetical protein